MDGYALRHGDIPSVPCTLTLIGESAAGHAFAGNLADGQTVRIFTGAALPEGADCIVMQEDCTRDGTTITIHRQPSPGQHVRRRGLDFTKGKIGLPRGQRLSIRDMGLAAAMDHARLPVHRRPRVAIISTGDELAAPGTQAPPEAIVASNNLVLSAFIQAEGAEAVDFGIIPDRMDETSAAIRRARDEGFDILVTTGGASVGDHDLIHRALTEEGVDMGVWKIAMRPGKPFMTGDLGQTRILGLPGNPVSTYVCAILFLRPLIRLLSGRQDLALVTEPARLGRAMKPNDLREDYVRATLDEHQGEMRVTPAPVQDSSMLSVLAAANALILRPPFDPAKNEGDLVQIIRL